MIIDGKKIAAEIQKEIKQKLNINKDRAPCLAVILVGEHPPSRIYVNRKTQACAEVGIQSIKIALPSTIGQEDLLNKIHELNQNNHVDGILIQLPLPHHINPTLITHSIDPAKDIDGFHPLNVGKMLNGETDGFIPCTPLGIRVLLERYSIETTGKHVLVIGRSNIVGKPTAALFMQSSPSGNATVTVAHRYSKNLKQLCLNADIIIAAIGQPRFITAEMVKEGVVVIDVGINKIEDKTKPAGYAIVGDVDFDNVSQKASYITPVPGGVGPMTIAMLLHNTVQSFEKRIKK